MKQENYQWNETEAVIKNYSLMLYKIAYSYTRNKEDAEDVLQEVFIKFARQRNLDTEEYKKAWLIRVTINLSINVTKSSNKKKNIPLEYEKYPKNMGSTGIDETKLLVMELPIKYRAAMYLYYYEGYSVEEIAQILKKKNASIYTLLRRGREILKNVIEKGGSNHE